MNYKDLEIWKLAREVVLEIHAMTLKLPPFKLYEEGHQIRKSSKSVKAVIVEGYGRRIYKQDFLKFIIYAIGSNDETRDHLENLFETGSLKEETVYMSILTKVNELGKKLYRFYQSTALRHEARI